MATAIYVLCALTSAACAVLLTRAYLRSRTRLLLWSAWCFAFLALNNVLLVVDLTILTEQDLRVARTGSALIGVSLLLYGFIFNLDEGPRR